MNEPKLLSLVLMACAALTMLGCEADISTSIVVREIDGFIDDFTEPANPLVGTWTYSELDYMVTFVFREDYTFTETGIFAGGDEADPAVPFFWDGIYSITDDIIILDYYDVDLGSLHGIWEIAGDNLIVIPIEDGVELEDETVVFTRLD